MKTTLLSIVGALCLCASAWAASETRLSVNFDHPLQVWDGFGVNYVEAAQTRDYSKDPQDYGGFSTLSEAKRNEILDLIFGRDGLKPGVAKMFLDPWLQRQTLAERGAFDHETTTKWMRYFIREGLARTRADGRDLEIVTTLYGPPAWATKQKFMRGRDLDPVQKQALATYMIDWTKFLIEHEKFPVKYLSLHNEGEDFNRWPVDGSTGGSLNNDYNMYWPSSQVVDFLRFMRPLMDRAGLTEVGLTPGETSSWDRFGIWGYSWSIANDPEALANLGLITSHGFGGHRQNNGIGPAYLRLKRPELKSWTTSTSWGSMDTSLLENIRENIYDVKVNAVIPWATIQTNTWIGGDPNPGTAFRVDGKGGYSVEPGYYYFKQVSRIGQPGMRVAEIAGEDQDLKAIAFTSNGTGNPDGFAVFNLGQVPRNVVVEVRGSTGRTWKAFETSPVAHYESVPVQNGDDGTLRFTVPANGVVTCISRR